ncbi:hypothetical protein RI129_005862 [Pyrocoelia pectoralis]|uniref:HSF-type DNA-binding domain-containing protein n=1 Tax=Pyrocoelia pectoralis TaxID=417401 RepID=A0AAN7VBG4_9COLE
MKTENNYKTIPAFLGKLWKMVNDPKTENLICWGKDGNTFIIRNEIQFWRTLLPLYYKHNNMSSFIRQLNMYGFHKISLLNGSVTNDKIEFEFIHPCFQRDQPGLLKNIKRKVTNPSKYSSPEKNVPEVANPDQLTKLLADVKFLHSRQAQVDVVINNLKQENSVLWRELAVLRQKHQKQIQIVNKLIQFLLTVVQPSTRRGGLGVKRRYPLMLNENPEKKPKKSQDGPTIHELDSAEVLPDDFLQVDVGEIPQVDSPISSNQQNQSTQINEVESNLDSENVLVTTSDLDNSKGGNLEDLLGDTDLNEEIIIPNSLEDGLNFSNAQTDLMDTNYVDVLLNQPTSDPFLANIMDGSYNSNVVNGIVNQNHAKQEPAPSTSSTDKSMTLAKCYPNLAVPQLNTIDDIHHHQESTQSELDQLKEYLNGYTGIDSKYLLNLFNETPSYGLHTNSTKREDDNPDLDIPTGLGSELAPYEPMIDLNELFQESRDGSELVRPEDILASPTSQNETDTSLLDFKSLFSSDD